MSELNLNKKQDGNDKGNAESATPTNYENSLENIAGNQTHGDNSRRKTNTGEHFLDLTGKMDKTKVMCQDPLVVCTSNKLGEEAEVRDTWANKVEFILACIGNVVGLGNMWRFPYLCYKSGGGAFLIPYFIMLVVCGIPLLYMELAVGQYTRQGPIGAMHKMCPLFKGTGLATVIMSFLLSTYYNVIIAWALYYLINSFMDPLPWEGCNNDWNSELCWNGTKFNSSQDQEANNKTSAPQEFYDNHLLQMTKGIDNFGTMRWELLACLAVAWILVYFCLWKGIKSTGKVVYVTATLPYLFIGAFIVRALTLPGSELGLVYFFSPKWETLLEAKVWVNAAAQNFNSIGIAFGSLMAFSSYNRFDNRLMRDTLIISLTDAVTCILAGICVFGTLGNLAFEQGKSVDEVVSSGPGLVFVAYPAALSKMPFPHMPMADGFAFI
ncbi:Transporter [Daphnia magna]|uniref:Transporter n=1 Tax=Daphnia magna TaxID=35525 RepID=A0A164X6I1_9CRUS|nr:Transporter [Daphnia magna]